MSGCGDIQVVNSIVSGIGAESLEHAGVVVADGSDMELLGPAAGMVHDCELVEHGAAELAEFLFVGSLAVKHLAEDGVNLSLGVVVGIEILQTVVGKLASHGSEEIVTYLERLKKVVETANLDSGHLCKFLYISLVCGRILDCHGLVRTPCRDHLGSEGMLRDLLVPAEIVHGIVRSAHYAHIEFADKSLRTEFFRSKLGIAFFVYLAGGLGLQDLVDAECTGKLQMGPVIERVAKRVRHGLRPFLEFFPGAAVAGDVFFGNAVSAHRAPLVVVSPEPYFGDVGELVVFRYHLGIQMAMIIDDGHAFRTLVIQFAGGIATKHEVFVDERFHYI